MHYFIYSDLARLESASLLDQLPVSGANKRIRLGCQLTGYQSDTRNVKLRDALISADKFGSRTGVFWLPLLEDYHHCHHNIWRAYCHIESSLAPVQVPVW